MFDRPKVCKGKTSLLVVFLTLALIPTNFPSIATAETVVIGMAGLNFSFLPFEVALKKSFYQKQGLEVKPVLMRAQSAIPALISGDIDYDTHFGSLVRGAVRGLPIRIILSTAEKQMFSL